MTANPPDARQHWMSVLARASAEEMAHLLASLPPLPAATALRGPEVGLVMLRGRAGGGGGKFNLGEATVTRCTMRSETGFVGHAYRLGRDTEAAALAARLDAALQDPSLAGPIADGVVAKLAEAQAARRTEAASRAAATKVQFFTMATMRT